MHKEKLDQASRRLPESFRLGTGLGFSFLAGALSAVFNLSRDAGQPLTVMAEHYGEGQLERNVVYIFSCVGAFLTTALNCLFLHFRHGTMGGSTSNCPPARKSPSLPFNFSMAH